MGYNTITNVLEKIDKDEIPRIKTIKWIEIFDQSNRTYNPNKDIRFTTPHIRDDLCDFNDAYIVVTGKITATNPGNNNILYRRKVALKNYAPFFNCILKINNQLIEDAQDLDIVMPMYNLLYYSKNFRKTTGSFWNYYPDIPKCLAHYDPNLNPLDTPATTLRKRVSYQIKDSDILDYKNKLVRNVPGVVDIVNNDAESELYH